MWCEYVWAIFGELFSFFFFFIRSMLFASIVWCRQAKPNKAQQTLLFFLSILRANIVFYANLYSYPTFTTFHIKVQNSRNPRTVFLYTSRIRVLFFPFKFSAKEFHSNQNFLLFRISFLIMPPHQFSQLVGMKCECEYSGVCVRSFILVWLESWQWSNCIIVIDKILLRWWRFGARKRWREKPLRMTNESNNSSRRRQAVLCQLQWFD